MDCGLLTERQLNHTFEDFGKALCPGKMVLNDIYSAIRRMIVKDGIAFHAAGLIADENYVAFTNRYQSEQAKILQNLSVLDSRIERQNDYHANAEKLREVICDYLNIDKLTPHILNKLIKKIQVGIVEVTDDQSRQEIIIVWRFVEFAF